MALQRQLATPAYLVGFSLLCIPPIDAMMQVLPLRLSDPRWRYGTFGLLSNALMMTLLGLLLVFLVATIFEHRLFQKVLGAFSLFAAIVIAGLFVVFALDALQVRPGVAPAANLGFKVATVTAALKSMLGILTLGAFGWAAFRTPKLPRPGMSSRPSSMIIGSPASPKASGSTPRPPAPGPSQSSAVGAA